MRRDYESAARALAVEAALIEVVDRLAGDGIDVVLFKGPAIARWLYDDPAERDFDDLDLLVAPDRYDRAGRVLAAAGFAERPALAGDGESSRHAALWTRDGPPAVSIDLHRAPFLLHEQDHAAVWQALTEGSGRLELGGAAIAVPGTAAHALIVVLHAAQHGYRADRSRADLERALERVSSDDWRAAARLARSLEAEDGFAAGLRMLPAGAELADRLELPSEVSRRLRLHLQQGPKTWPGFERLAKLSSPRARARTLAGMVFPSPRYLRLADPLARRGPAGLAVAFVLRPVRLLVRAPAGYLAWRAVAREERGAPPSGRMGLALDAVRRAWWAARALRACRMQLAGGGLEAVRLPRPPACRSGGERGIGRALGAGRARCLERALIRQSWLQSCGDERDLVVGVTRPGPGFRAHAWLAGDREDTSAFSELRRRPPTRG